MKYPNEILVTTTSSIEGMNVTKYFKPISAHVVAGTNFFSDFFASFSDVFGGRSQTYQRQLSSIYAESIEILKRSAYELGANCIVGLRVDLDEISGKGKSMFMITATGTAVLIEGINKTENKSTPTEKLEVISFEKMIELRERKSIIQLALDNKLELDDSTWEFLSKNGVYEISDKIIEIAAVQHELLNADKKKLYQQLLTYLFALSDEQRTSLLYGFLMKGKTIAFDTVIYRLIEELMVFDSEKIQVYLHDSNEDVKMKALQIVVTDKQFYKKEDIEVYEKLIKNIESNYSKIGEITSQKKLLSSKEKEIWICKCGNKNHIEAVYCNKCNKDIYGYNQGWTNPEKAIEKIRENIEIIKNNVV